MVFQRKKFRYVILKSFHFLTSFKISVFNFSRYSISYIIHNYVQSSAHSTTIPASSYQATQILIWKRTNFIRLILVLFLILRNILGVFQVFFSEIPCDTFYQLVLMCRWSENSEWRMKGELFFKHCFGLPNRCSVFQAEVSVIKVSSRCIAATSSLFQGGEHSLVQQRGNTSAALANCALKVS